MSTQMTRDPATVTHVDKRVIRTSDGRIASVQEHAFKELASEHAKHSSAAAEALAAQARAVEQKSNLGMQVAELRGRLIEVQEQLAGRTEALRREEVTRADVEAKLQGRERQIRSLQAREKQVVAAAQADAQAALKELKENTPPPVGLVTPDPEESAEDYLKNLANLELQIVEIEGRTAPVHWVIPGTVAAPASEAAS